MSNNGMRCPKCGNDCQWHPGVTSLDGWDDDLANGYVFVDFTCPSCKSEFTNVYKLEKQELTYEEEE